MLSGGGAPRLARGAVAGPPARPAAAAAAAGLRARARRAAGLACRTLDHGAADASSAAFFGGDGAAPPAKPLPAAAAAPGILNAVKQQLRQAVHLASVDFDPPGAGGAAGAAGASLRSSDWDDDGEADASGDDLLLDAAGGSAAAVGAAVYETLRVDAAGRARRVATKRRDLIRAHGLQPRDLRRLDPTLGPSGGRGPSLTVKDEAVLINVGGVRAIMTAERCLLFEPESLAARRFVEHLVPRLQAAAADRARADAAAAPGPASWGADGDQAGGGGASPSSRGAGAAAAAAAAGAAKAERHSPFELEVLEAALMVASGKLEAELVAATKRVGDVLRKLPREVTPVNLEELRRVKGLLVGLESKAETLKELLEELMDDEDEMADLNLSSRPAREEKRRARERERLEREVSREWGEWVADNRETLAAAAADGSAGPLLAAAPPFLAAPAPPAEARRARRASARRSGADAAAADAGAPSEPASDGFEAAQDALAEMEEEEEEERELEEVEDLLEYYLQRAANTASEAERLLAGARDLEESIAVSLSARRFEVNRLELLLSMASFAAALGAMVASIFGMNLRSTLEMSVVGFWGTTALIVAGSAWVFYAIWAAAKRKRVL
jgi:hypothetical protein